MNYKTIKLVSRIFFLSLFVLIIGSCTVNNESITLQLTDIQQELKALKQETSQLRTAITEIHRTTVVAPLKAVAIPETIIPEVKVGKRSAILGNKNAKIAIVEFSDYQCPFCNRFYKSTLGKIKQNYIDSGKVVLFYRDFPLGFHSEAKAAAIAANCAGKQNKYWQVHDRLYDNFRNLNHDLYFDIAKKLNLNSRKFTACLSSSLQKTKVEQDFSYGQTLNVTGTPSFFIGIYDGEKLINAKKLTGAQPYSAFSSMIDSISFSKN